MPKVRSEGCSEIRPEMHFRGSDLDWNWCHTPARKPQHQLPGENRRRRHSFSPKSERRRSPDGSAKYRRTPSLELPSRSEIPDDPAPDLGQLCATPPSRGIALRTAQIWCRQRLGGSAWPYLATGHRRPERLADRLNTSSRARTATCECGKFVHARRPKSPNIDKVRSTLA